jgi:EmrB/QacA subfamily drug resistance transporter
VSVSRKWGALLSVSLATLMLLIDFMAVSVALPAIRGSLGASLAQLQWVIEAFVLTLAAFVLTAGHIADVKGGRPAFLLGLVIFSVGSLLGWLAPSAIALIGARVVQGLGGALLFATGPGLLTKAFSDGRGKLALAVWGTLTGLAVALSPLVGGLITTYLGWRWIFLINVPIGALALAVGAVAIEEPPQPAGDAEKLRAATLRRGKHLSNPRPQLDWRGLVLFSAAIAILVVGLLRTTQAGWSQSGVLACFVCTGLLLVAFVAVEGVEPVPMLDIALFRKRTFAGSAIAAFGLSVAVLGPFMFLVLYLFDDLGYSLLTISLRLLLLTGMTVPFLPVANWLDRHIPVRFLICVGLALVAVGLWLMSHLSPTSTWTSLAPGFLLAGVGLELVNPRLASAAAAAVRPNLAVMTSRTSSTMRQVGAATGVAVLGSVFSTRINDGITNGLSGIPQLLDQVPRVASLVLQGRTAQAVSLAGPTARANVLLVVQRSFADAMHAVLLVAAGVALASAALALLVRSRDVPRPIDRTGRRSSGTGRAGSALAPTGEANVPVALSSSVARAGAPGNASRVEPPPDSAHAAAIAAASPETRAATARPGTEAAGAATCTSAEAPPGAPGAAGAASHLAGTPAGHASDHSVGTVAAMATAGTTAAVPAASNGVATDDPLASSWHVLANLFGTAAREPEAEPEAVAQHVPPRATEDVIDLARALGCVRGQVTTVTGDPVAGATVTLVDATGDEAGCVVASKDGCFSLVNLSEGNYTLVAAAPHYKPAANSVALQDGGADARVSLVGIGSLAGQVTRARDGAPLLGEVELSGPEEGSVVVGTTDHEGRFQFPDIIEGSYTALVRCAGYRQEELLVVITRGTATRVEIALVGQAHLYGSVSGAEGGWIPSVRVSLVDGLGTVVERTLTDGAGSYVMPEVPEGSYTVMVACDQGAASMEVDLEPGAAVLADLMLGVR